MSNILILTPQLPYPPHQGTSLRNYHIIRGLAQQHQVTLLSFLEPNQTAVSADIQPLLDVCARVESVPAPPRSTATRLWQLLVTRLPDMAHRLYSPHFSVRLRHLLVNNSFDIVQIEGIELARYVDDVRAAAPTVKVIFDDHNAETELQWRNFLTDLRIPRRWPAAVYSWIQTRRLRRFERWAMQQADAVTAVSHPDRDHLLKLLHGAQINADKRRSKDRMTDDGLPITVIPNSIDVTAYETPPEEVRPFDLVFSGKMDYRPNVDAVLWFAQAVWPLLRAQRPSTTWAIVGQKPHARLDGLREAPGVTVTGWVESIRPYLHGARVVIMPFRIGSGTRLKLIEAMAAGKALVSTPVGAEGFPVQHGREIVLAETAAEMATAVLRLLDDPVERERLGTAARVFAQQYDWRQVVPAFNRVYEQVGVMRDA